MNKKIVTVLPAGDTSDASGFIQERLTAPNRFAACDVQAARNLDETLIALDERDFEAVFLVLPLPDYTARAALERLRAAAEIRLQAFADQAAIAIENARLYDAVQQYAVGLEARVSERTAELQKTADRLSTILDNSSDAILLIDPQGQILQVNPSFEIIFGCSAAQFTGQSFFTLAAEDDLTPLVQKLHQLFHTGGRERGSRLRREVDARSPDESALQCGQIRAARVANRVSSRLRWRNRYDSRAGSRHRHFRR